jgi:hypothetical protein
VARTARQVEVNVHSCDCGAFARNEGTCWAAGQQHSTVARERPWPSPCPRDSAQLGEQQATASKQQRRRQPRVHTRCEWYGSGCVGMGGSGRGRFGQAATAQPGTVGHNKQNGGMHSAPERSSVMPRMRWLQPWGRKVKTVGCPHFKASPKPNLSRPGLNQLNRAQEGIYGYQKEQQPQTKMN